VNHCLGKTLNSGSAIGQVIDLNRILPLATCSGPTHVCLFHRPFHFNYFKAEFSKVDLYIDDSKTDKIPEMLLAVKLVIPIIRHRLDKPQTAG
jgi:hypothetical protein